MQEKMKKYSRFLQIYLHIWNFYCTFAAAKGMKCYFKQSKKDELPNKIKLKVIIYGRLSP